MVLAKDAGMNNILLLTGEGSKSLNENRHLWSVTEPKSIAENSLIAVDKNLNNVNLFIDLV